jgi:recombination protein U
MINYPNRKKTQIQSSRQATNADRGMGLEHDINLTNAYYRDLDRAVIHKKPTPITVVKVDYPSRTKAKISEAYYKVPSTTDYNGVYRGRYIDFEAKETQSKTAFALSNLHAHQIEHMQQVHRHGGLSFLLIRFATLDETYLLSIEKLTHFLTTQTRKSLPYAWIKEQGQLVSRKLTPPLDYLNALDMIG